MLTPRALIVSSCAFPNVPNVHLHCLINPNPLVMAETLRFSICHTPLDCEMVKMQDKMNVSVGYLDKWCISSLETRSMSCI